MRDELLLYYERELLFLRQMGAEFADKYPKIASRLVLEPDKCEDPHVERMLEGFALLAGRVHLKLDDDFPQVTEALLNVLYPHYLRPVPSMSVAEFEIDLEQVKPEAGLRVPRGAVLLSRPVDGLPCRFRTCYDLTFWPLTVVDAQWRADRAGFPARGVAAMGALRIELQCAGGIPFSKLALDSLRFYINAESDVAHTLYELVCDRCAQIVVRDAGGRPGAPVVTLPSSALVPVGFGPEESALPYTHRSFAGYQVIQEYLAFPQKFLFFELRGLDQAVAAGLSDRIEILLLIAPFERADRRHMLETGVSARTFRMGCAPIVNLFPHTAEPILLDHLQPEYQVVADVTRRHGMEIFSVEEVLGADSRSQEVTTFEPLYALRHAGGRRPGRAYYHATRRPSGRRNDDGTEVFVTLVDLSGRLAVPDVQSITVRTVCTNRDLAARLPFGNEAGDLELEGAAPIRKIVTLVKPTATLRPPAAKDAFWRLISQLSLNYLSLVEDGAEALREMLRLYNFSGSNTIEDQIGGITSLRSQRHFAPLPEADAIAFARGTRVEIEFDEERFVGGGVYLFASILEYFLGQYVSMNSFSQLLARTRQRKEVLKLWPPRAGRKVLL